MIGEHDRNIEVKGRTQWKYMNEYDWGQVFHVLGLHVRGKGDIERNGDIGREYFIYLAFYLVWLFASGN